MRRHRAGPRHRHGVLATSQLAPVIAAGSPTTETALLQLVHRSHDVGAEPDDSRFPSRTKAATRSAPPTWPELVQCDHLGAELRDSLTPVGRVSEGIHHRTLRTSDQDVRRRPRRRLRSQRRAYATCRTPFPSNRLMGGSRPAISPSRSGNDPWRRSALPRVSGVGEPGRPSRCSAVWAPPASLLPAAIRKEARRQQQRPHAGGPVRVEPPGHRDARERTSLDGNLRRGRLVVNRFDVHVNLLPSTSVHHS